MVNKKVILHALLAGSMTNILLAIIYRLEALTFIYRLEVLAWRCWPQGTAGMRSPIIPGQATPANESQLVG